MMKGNDLLITAADGTLYANKSAELTVDGEVIEVASPMSGRWREYIAGRKTWAVSCGYLVSDTRIKTDALKVGQTVSVTIGKRGGSSAQLLHGTAIVTSFRVTGNRGNLAQGAFGLKGTGALE